MFCLWSLSFVLLVVADCGWCQLSSNHRCTDTEIVLKTGYLPHDTYCDLYYQCVPGGRAWTRRCAKGLLWDDATKTCNRPSAVTPRSGCCENVNSIQRLRCCDSYVLCKQGAIAIVDCSSGEVFDSRSNQCVTNGTNALCLNDESCERNSAPRISGTETVFPCYLRELPTDECSYLQDVGNVTIERRCAAGLAFNITTCGCSTSAKQCFFNISRANKVFDTQCRPTLIMDFSSPTSQVLSYTEKTDNNQRQLNSFKIISQGYHGAGSLGTDQFGGEAYLSIPFFKHNMLKAPFAMKFQFNPQNFQNGRSFSLVSNKFPTETECEGTLDVQMTYSNRQWTLRAFVTTTNGDGAHVTGQTEASINAADNARLNVIIIFDGVLRGLIWENVSRNPISFSTQRLGTEIAVNTCDFRIATGFNGVLSEVTFYEACGQLSRVDPLIQV